MGITAKELAKKLGLSAAAVSMALNGKKGVSTETRRRVKEEAQRCGYDFRKVKEKEIQNGHVSFLIYRKNGVIVEDTPFFKELESGVAAGLAELGYKMKKKYVYEEEWNEEFLSSLRLSDCIGIILLGTEISSQDFKALEELSLPCVLLDNYMPELACDSVLINNVQGAFLATMQLIHSSKAQPGYLSSVYRINNFDERADGYYKAIRSSGMSTSHCIVHRLLPSIDGAYEDMKELLANHIGLAKSYFADNDLIALGAMKAFLEYGYKIPEDIRIIGFDNLPMAKVFTPALSTVDVPKLSMGKEAAYCLHERIHHPGIPYRKTEMNIELLTRESSK